MNSKSYLQCLRHIFHISLMVTLLSSCTLQGAVYNGQGKRKSVPLKRYSAIAQYPGRKGVLTEKEKKMAVIAWKYFENNYQEKTGLVNAVDNYPSVTLWDTASYLGGMVAARELGIIDKTVFDKRMIALLKTLNTFKLFQNQLPNKVYHTQTAKKVNYTNKPGEIGYSALDLGRLLIWLRIIKERYPEFSDGIDNAILRWNFCHVVNENGTLFGAYKKKGKPVTYVQEGRLGYEEYAAKGFALWGFNVTQAIKPEPYNTIDLFGVSVPYDSRDPRKLKAHNYVVTESYVLDGIELNWDLPDDYQSSNVVHTQRWMADFAQRIYKAQELRYHNTGIITARTEHQLAGPPYFVYDTIYTDGYSWNTITESGKFVPQYAAIALKGAMGMWVLWETDYTDLLFDTVSDLYHPEKGFYEGKFENGKGLITTFTANNNGIILEALLYKEQGKLLRFRQVESRWDKVIADEFQGADKCYPD